MFAAGYEAKAQTCASHSLAVKRDGTVWAWGQNGRGQLGDGTTTSRSTPAQVSGLAGIVAVAAGSGWGSEHSLALESDGTVWAWGANTWGQLGDGTLTNRLTPVQVSGLIRAVGITAGDAWSLVVKDDGTVWEWPAKGGRQWGEGSIPVMVSGITATAADAGGCYYYGQHSLALRPDGTLWSWGDNSYTQLGDGTAAYRLTPVQVAGLTGVVAVGAGWSHSLALTRDGTVWAWGFNEYGLGVEEPEHGSAPVQVAPPGSPDLAIAMTHAGDLTVGDRGVYTLTITNTGRTATDGTLTVLDTLPPGLTLVSASGVDWSCSAADQMVTCMNPGPVRPGASSTTRLTDRKSVV